MYFRPFDFRILVLLLVAALGQTRGYTVSNKPLMLLVSFDGFRWDYLHKYNLTNFNYLKSIGSHAEFIYNSFATVTFPNHWTLVTGMYEETHGIIQNEMYDKDLKKEFNHMSNESQTREWYGQNKLTEPIWISNQRAGGGRKSAAEWVGAGVSFNDQSALYIPYNNSKPYNDLIDEFITLFTRDEEPINFGALYFDEPDHTGHLFGPYSNQMEQKLYSLDKTLGYLIDELKSHNLFDDLNLIITSDHGMEAISEKTAIFLDSYIDTSLFDAYGSRACYSLFVKNDTSLEYVYKVLKNISNIEVYKKNEIPAKLNYKQNVRIGDIVIITKLGYGVYIRNQTINWDINKGDHGYSNDESSMFPIFISHGPAFKKNFTIPSFRNVDIYPLMCFILGIQPATNNGTLENVLDMVVYNTIDANFGLFFVLFSLIPVTLLVGTLAFLFYYRKKNKINYSDYSSIETDGVAIDVDNLSVRSPIISG